MTSEQRSVVKMFTTPIGEVLHMDGVDVVCVERPFISCPQDACKGCWFSINYKSCPPSQCSKFGRTDGKNVWFVEVSKVGGL